MFISLVGLLHITGIGILKLFLSGTGELLRRYKLDFVYNLSMEKASTLPM
jgi:hypothetical protein